MTRRRRRATRAWLLAAASLALAGAVAPASEPVFRGVRPLRLITEHLDGTTFRAPRGLHVDPANKEIFLADTGNGLIGIFDLEGVPKYSFRAGRSTDYPSAVTTDPTGNIYVLNSSNGEVRVFDYRGQPIRRIAPEEIDGIVSLAIGIKMGPDRMLYLLDGAGRRILVYSPEGTRIRVIQGRGIGSRQLRAPADFAFGGDGLIYVTDRSSMPVQVYDTNGNFVRGWGRREMGVENFSTPGGICVDEEGLVFVADAVRQDIKVFDQQGAFLGRFGGFGGRPGEVAYPSALALAPGGRILVLERVGRRLQIMEKVAMPGASNNSDGADRDPVAVNPSR